MAPQEDPDLPTTPRLSVLEEVWSGIVALPIRVEYLGGQRTSYVQRATVLDWLHVEIEKEIAKL